MKIHQVLNNNVVSTLEEGQEIIVFGTGIGFQKRKGDTINESIIQNRFISANNTLTKQVINLMESMSEEIVEIVVKIISKTEIELGTKLNSGIYLTLMDHISFSIERYHEGIVISNSLLWDVKRLYLKEFELGRYAVSLINEAFDVVLDDEEAANIAVHILNANYNVGLDLISAMSKIIKDIVKIIEYYFNQEFDEQSLDYLRLVNHLRFFAQRILNKTPYDDKENPLLESIRANYSEAFNCAKRIETYVLKEYECVISEEELVYLAVHIQRLINTNPKGLSRTKPATP